MNIGDVSEHSGLPVKTIRYYEGIGLVRPARSANGYRQFHADHLHKQKFIGQARSLEFSLDECRELMSLYEDREGPADETRAIANRHIRRMNRKIPEPQAMSAALREIAVVCDRPDCPILHELSHARKCMQDEESSFSRYCE